MKSDEFNKGVKLLKGGGTEKGVGTRIELDI